ncbi:hypothetical protein ACFQLX_08040 [Streptomyces polyrhachis]|uniref:Lipoprotein n=1 Tax=Streptomyces polyrhachis TaxID=1282885 RepID=A0ABW2GEZ8_9ACTN
MYAPRRTAIALCAATALGVSAAGCSTGAGGKAADPKAATAHGRLIGDGSTAYTGAQPHQPPVRKLAAGERPPQFVVFSWDGAGEDDQRLFSRFRKVARASNASMTYFLSGIYTLPRSQRMDYQPPGHPRGSSDIGFLDIEEVRATLEQLRLAWRDGSEIGTHFNGHFCGPGGVSGWTVDQWKSEIQQAKRFVKEWRTNTGWQEAEPLPFDYERELAGGRAPCLEGQKNLMKAAGQLGLRYDSSGVNSQVWPSKRHGIWDLSLQNIPFPGRDFEVVSMDYNFMSSQSGPALSSTAQHAVYEKEMRAGLRAGFERAYRGNRAPLFIGNHFESWNGGAYMRAVEDAIRTVCRRAEVRCVSFRQLADWLDAQDPAVLAKLRRLDVGEAPEGGWARYLAAAPSATPSAAGAGSARGPQAG